MCILKLLNTIYKVINSDIEWFTSYTMLPRLLFGGEVSFSYFPVKIVVWSAVSGGSWSHFWSVRGRTVLSTG